MEVCGVYDDSYMTTTKIPCSSEVLDSLWVPTDCSPSFEGSPSMVNFEVGNSNPDRPPFPVQLSDCKVASSAEEFDGSSSFHQPSEKKRRLTPNQVKYLEKSFEADNKLEPDRKTQLAKELGLQPRQVAIWFQNRRARYKTKVLEREYDSLKANYDKLKKDYDTLSAENEKLKNEVQLLTQKLLVRTKGELGSPPDQHQELWDPISPLDLQPKEDQFFCPDSSSNCDVFDSDNHSGTLEPTADSQMNSDFDEDDTGGGGGRLLQPQQQPIKLEVLEYLQPNSCGLGFPDQDQGTWFWQY